MGAYKNPNTPPQKNCTRSRENEMCVQLFFLHDTLVFQHLSHIKSQIKNTLHINGIYIKR